MANGDPEYRAVRRDGVLRVARRGTEWLSSGWNGGRRTADVAYNVSVPDGWDRTDLSAYVAARLERAGFGSNGDERDAPVLLTGVDLEHARGSRCGSVTAYATAGLSNPAALPMDPDGGTLPDSVTDDGPADEPSPDPLGTVNLVVGTTRALASGALANLLAVAAEAKAATLLSTTGFPGTTTDAIAVGHAPDGRASTFSGSATPVGAATRACVRDAVTASLRSRYEDADGYPASVAEATYGVSTDVEARVFRPPIERDS
ncbi:adenosylcobinamide amidohydrolase [Natrarchaeobius oligotrophus]|uniref:Adenosylcobinamide amidohydrolase n=1 Tax=Natrarchaeobius chitinivorans TaxID=1679083 RepID=A0A3N6MEZ3_NATCH|nr:adenosylcobinamide amidohydrolase [Natrarchaeobius chitinivorans]RQH01438.1 adenosylcobinamide amidohydrolase [Natrarchaeobius chitinivorans]